MGGSDPPFGFDNGGPASLQWWITVTSWYASKSLSETPLYVPMMMPPSQGISSQNTEWNGRMVIRYNCIHQWSLVLIIQGRGLWSLQACNHEDTYRLIIHITDNSLE